MKKLLGFAIVVAALTMFAPSAEACFQCEQYFYPPCECWCWTCTPTYCGDFDCSVVQRYGIDWCRGEDGCFDVGRGCVEEPPISSVHPRLEDTWRLAEVRIVKQAKSKDKA